MHSSDLVRQGRAVFEEPVLLTGGGHQILSPKLLGTGIGARQIYGLEVQYDCTVLMTTRTGGNQDRLQSHIVGPIRVVVAVVNSTVLTPSVVTRN